MKYKYRAKILAKARANKGRLPADARTHIASTMDLEPTTTPGDGDTPVPNGILTSPSTTPGGGDSGSPRAGPSNEGNGYHSPRPARRPQRLAKLRASKAWRRVPSSGSEAASPVPDYVQQVGQLASVLQSPGSSEVSRNRRCRYTDGAG